MNNKQLIIFFILKQTVDYRLVPFNFFGSLLNFINNEDFKIVNFNYIINNIDKQCNFNYKTLFLFHIDNCYQYKPGDWLYISSIYHLSANNNYYKKKLIVRELTNVSDNKNFLIRLFNLLISSIFRFSSFIRLFIKEKSVYYLTPEANNLFISLIFGKEKIISDDKQSAFFEKIKTLGFAHIIAISGYHINVLSGFLKNLFFIFSKKKKAILIIFFLPFYILLSGGSPSIIRSVSMIIISLIASSFFLSQYNSLYALFVVFLLMLAFDIFYLFDIGFQLSFLATFAILVYYKIFKNQSNSNSEIIVIYQDKTNTSLFKKISNFLKENIFFLFFLQLFIFPLTTYYFKQFNFLMFITSVIFNFIFSLIITLGYYLAFSLVLLDWLGIFGQVVNTIMSKIFNFLVIILNYLVDYFYRFNQTVINIENFCLTYVFIWYMLLLIIFIKGLQIKNKVDDKNKIFHS